MKRQSKQKRRKEERRGPQPTEREVRIRKQIAAGWIKDASEIPADAIPVDPEFPPSGGWIPPRFYQDYRFDCCDCGVDQVWTAEAQRWYHEDAGAPYFMMAVRCRACRRAERERITQARLTTERGEIARAEKRKKRQI